MAITRWDPFRELESVNQRLNRFFGRGRLVPDLFGESFAVAEWSPAVDVAETAEEYIVKAELPEVRKEDVKVTIENGTLHIAGERKQEKEEKNKKFHRVERSYGTFLRTFAVPLDAEENKVAADFKDGILRVHLPKAEKPRPKAIEVKVAS